MAQAPTPADFAAADPARRVTAADRASAAEARLAGLRVANVFHGILLATNVPELTIRQAAVLARAVEVPGEQTVRGLAGSFGISKPAISRALDRLGELGLAARRTLAHDRRIIVVDPTATGRAWIAAVAALIGEA